MNFVIYAVPFFLLLIFVELAWGVWRGQNSYRVNDSLNSLSLGMLSTLTKLVFLDIGGQIFAGVEQGWALFSVDMGSPLMWVLGFLAYDFCYYWFHRISHERTLFWGSHVVHHQSEDFNLSTALRQTSTGVFTNWVFYLPLFFLGMPIEMYVSIASLHLIYQFWIHTEFVPKLGWLELFLITPSNHRVHHAQNPRYVDRNYGGLLCIWDRLFGTFIEECDEEKVVYGITTPLNTWNPLWANVHIFSGMLSDTWHTRSFADKARVWVSRTGWHPADRVAPAAKKRAFEDFRKYDPALPVSVKVSLVIQYVLATAVYFWMVLSAGETEWALRCASLLLVLAGLMSMGWISDRHPRAGFREGLRCVLTAGLLALAGLADLASPVHILWGSAYLLVSALLAGFSVQRLRSSDDRGAIIEEASA